MSGMPSPVPWPQVEVEASMKPTVNQTTQNPKEPLGNQEPQLSGADQNGQFGQFQLIAASQLANMAFPAWKGEDGALSKARESTEHTHSKVCTDLHSLKKTVRWRGTKKTKCWTIQVHMSHVQNVYSLAPDKEMFTPLLTFLLSLCAHRFCYAHILSYTGLSPTGVCLRLCLPCWSCLNNLEYYGIAFANDSCIVNGFSCGFVPANIHAESNILPSTAFCIWVQYFNKSKVWTGALGACPMPALLHMKRNCQASNQATKQKKTSPSLETLRTLGDWKNMQKVSALAGSAQCLSTQSMVGQAWR